MPLFLGSQDRQALRDSKQSGNMRINQSSILFLSFSLTCPRLTFLMSLVLKFHNVIKSIVEDHIK